MIRPTNPERRFLLFILPLAALLMVGVGLSLVFGDGTGQAAAISVLLPVVLVKLLHVVGRRR